MSWLVRPIVGRMLWDALIAPRPGVGGVTLVDSDGAQEISWPEVIASGRRAARGLQDRGVCPGDRVGVVLTNSSAAVAALAGVWFAGATAVSLPIISRGMSVDGYLAQIARLCGHASVELLLVDEELRGVFSAEAAGVSVAGFGMIEQTEGSADPRPPADDAVAFVQFSSGTTGTPLGAALTARAIGAQLVALADAVALDPETDRVSAWLPLSHDMGLFGCLLLSWYTGARLLLGTPQRFLASPPTWLEDCAEFDATLSAIQPSALRLAVRAAQTKTAGGRASRLRACLVGGERIPAGALDEAADLLVSRGASAAALTPAYGLAEATLAVSVASIEEPPRALPVDGTAVWDGQVVEARDGERTVRVVSCGRPLGNVSVEIEGAGPVGQILVRSPSLASGYLDDPLATAAAFSDGALATGDVGFIRDGELYPLGRSDDVLNVAGRRINVLEIEEELSCHPALRAGCCAIVDVADDARVRLIAVAELAAPGGADLRALAQELRREALATGGLPLDECVFVERGRLPKTASGKVQRFRARQLASRADAASGRVVLRN